MSISVHFNGKPLNKISSGVQQHQERFSENEGRKVLEKHRESDRYYANEV